MPRRARLDAPGTLHHVIVRGINRRRIVNDVALAEVARHLSVSTSAILKIIKRASH